MAQQVRLRRKLPWLPKEEDDELQRQLTLFLWADAYQQSMRQWKQRFIREVLQLPTEPSILDYADKKQFWREKEVWEQRFQQIVHRRDTEPFRDAARVALRASECSWNKTRELVYTRDGGFCMVCGDAVPWKYYHCGHIIDRCVDGSDRMSNLVCMCNVDNMGKPVTETRAAYLQWARHGGIVKHVCALAWQGLAEADGQELPTQYEAA